MYIHQLENWPHLSWQEKEIALRLAEIKHLQGRLAGRMEALGFKLQEETYLKSVTEEVVKSSQIEGEILDQVLVRSSVAYHLGIEQAALNVRDRNIDGIVQLVLDATQNYSQALTKERLFHWHTWLFPTGESGFKKIKMGGWRAGAVQVVSGHFGKETVHFEGPSADRVEDEMCLFLDWVNHETTLDSVLKAAIAHFWFVTIHPFDDGNGRIGRAIADMLLARSENNSHRFYSLSSQIQKERKSYYNILEKTSKGSLQITSWIEWFFECLERAIENSISTLNTVLNKSKFWEIVSNIPFNERQRNVVNRLLEGFDGKLTTTKWAKITKCSQDTAYRDILDLIEKGILSKSPEKGRSTSYFLIQKNEN